jgi:hypothetical protein
MRRTQEEVRWEPDAMPIHKRGFLAYEAIRRSGMADISDAEAVIAFARDFCDVELSRDEVAEIERDYAKLMSECTEAEVEPYLQMIRSRDLDIDGEMDIEEGW